MNVIVFNIILILIVLEWDLFEGYILGVLCGYCIFYVRVLDIINIIIYMIVDNEDIMYYIVRDMILKNVIINDVYLMEYMVIGLELYMWYFLWVMVFIVSDSLNSYVVLWVIEEDGKLN